MSDVIIIIFYDLLLCSFTVVVIKALSKLMDMILYYFIVYSFLVGL